MKLFFVRYVVRRSVYLNFKLHVNTELPTPSSSNQERNNTDRHKKYDRSQNPGQVYGLCFTFAWVVVGLESP